MLQHAGCTVHAANHLDRERRRTQPERQGTSSVRKNPGESPNGLRLCAYCVLARFAGDTPSVGKTIELHGAGLQRVDLICSIRKKLNLTYFAQLAFRGAPCSCNLK